MTYSVGALLLEIPFPEIRKTFGKVGNYFLLPVVCNIELISRLTQLYGAIAMVILKSIQLISNPRNVTARQFLHANLEHYDVDLQGPHMTIAEDGANWAKRTGGIPGLKNFVSDLIALHLRAKQS